MYGRGVRVFRQLSGLEREVVVPLLVVGSLMVSVVAAVVIGAERPYPGVVLGSGLLLVLERAVAVWAIVLLALVIVEQAFRGRLPDEISGRGVRYVAQEQLGEAVERTVEAGGDVAHRLGVVEVALGALEQRVERLDALP